jgi:hypothetical protein
MLELQSTCVGAAYVSNHSCKLVLKTVVCAEVHSPGKLRCVHRQSTRTTCCPIHVVTAMMVQRWERMHGGLRQTTVHPKCSRSPDGSSTSSSEHCDVGQTGCLWFTSLVTTHARYPFEFTTSYCFYLASPVLLVRFRLPCRTACDVLVSS